MPSLCDLRTQSFIETACGSAQPASGTEDPQHCNGTVASVVPSADRTAATYQREVLAAV